MPSAYGHYIENTGTKPLVFLEMFRASRFEDISATQWMANIPPEIMSDTLNLPRALIEALPRANGPSYSGAPQAPEAATRTDRAPSRA